MTMAEARFTAHLDTFTRENLPPPEQLPEFLFELPELRLPSRLNAASRLLDDRVMQGWGSRLCLQAPEGLRWTWSDLQSRANRIANVLVREMGLVPGNRVLLRAPNSPMLVACWFAVLKAGGVAVATMPLLRAGELGKVIDKARISHALCDVRLAPELIQAGAAHPVLREIRWFGEARDEASLEAAMAGQPEHFVNVETAADDTAIIAFTSGTTGVPKGTMHFHRDLIAACLCWPRHMLKLRPEDVVIGSPPIAFTFGLGGLVLFPMFAGASTVLLEKATPGLLVEAIEAFRATVLFTAPTSYRAMAEPAGARRIGRGQGGSLRKCVAAGEALPASTRALWKQHTGIEIIDGIGATEMLHIFISTDEEHARAGATGLVVPGYRACVMDEHGKPAPVGTVGRLAVKGPTGCRYLDDPRQVDYVREGWNYTGDAYLMDDDGYFHFQSRTDDMIVSSGYNIGAPEVEEALLKHPAVAECAVVGAPDGQRGQIVKAFVVVRPGHASGDSLTTALQEFVKQTIAPYKYPRAIEYLDALPRTETGKLQRFRLRTEGARQ
jgi:2-aminobenzoate-CoA ligase